MSMSETPRVLIMHGWQNRRPHSHWQSWLAEQLMRERIPVIYPQLPDTDRPCLDAWLTLLESELVRLGDAKQIVICHSLSCLLWLYAAHRGVIDRPVHHVLLVAPPGPEAFTKDCESFFPIDFDLDMIVRSCRNNIRLVASNDDPFCVDGARSVYGTRYNFDCDTLNNAGHINEDSNFGPWPKVLQWVSNPSIRFCERILHPPTDLSRQSPPDPSSDLS